MCGKLELSERQLSIDWLSVQDISFALTKTGAPYSKNKASLFARVYIKWNGNNFPSAGFSATAASLEGVDVEFIVSLYHAVVDLVCSCSCLYLTCICVSWRRRYRRSRFDTHKSMVVEGHEHQHPWWSLIPASFFVSFPSDHYVVISYPCLFFSQAFDLTTMWWSLIPALFFHKLSIWPLCGDLLSLPLFPQAFDLTTMWYTVLISVSENFCDDDQGFHASLNLASFLTSFWYDHHVK